MPMRRSRASRSTPASAASRTRATMPITLRQAMRSRPVTADADVRAANHAAVSSNAVANRAP